MSLIKTNNANTPTYRSLLSDFFDTDGFFSEPLFKKDWVPSVNVKANENNYEIDLAAPGLKKEDFKVEVENGVLTISAEKKTEKEETDKKYTRKEFSYNSFIRSFALPENVEEDSISAKYEEGILRLTLKRTKVEKPNKKVISLQ